MSRWWPWGRARKAGTDLEPRAQFVYPRADAWPQRWPNQATAELTEDGALGLSGMYRAIQVIAGTLAALPMGGVLPGQDGSSRPIPSVFDNPDGPDGQTSFEWKETLFTHLVLHGKAGALIMRNQGGGIIRLPLCHPVTFTERWPDAEDYERGTLPVGGLWFDVRLANGVQITCDARDFWYVPGPSIDGRIGVGLLQRAQESLGTAQAGDLAAGTMFRRGALISGMVTPKEEIDPETDLPELKREINNAVGGWENAGTIAAFSQALSFTPWTMSAVDAQFLQGRQFSIEEISRWTGVPPHALMQTEKQTSWGTGVEMQDRGMGRSVLNPWSTRVEERGSRLLAAKRRLEFDFSALERPAPETEQAMTLELFDKGVIDLEEARTRLRLGPAPAALKEPAPRPAVEGGGPDADPDAQ